MPATSRSSRNNGTLEVRPIAARQIAVTAREPSNQDRREPGSRMVASKAPAK